MHESVFEPRFRWSRATVYWLLVVIFVGITLVLAEGADGAFPGLWLIFVGTALIGTGQILGSARTGRWFTWNGKVQPTSFEAYVGLTGAALAACPLVVLALRFATFALRTDM